MKNQKLKKRTGSGGRLSGDEAAETVLGRPQKKNNHSCSPLQTLFGIALKNKPNVRRS